MFPNLYEIVTDKKDASIHSNLWCQNKRNFKFIKDFNAWELESVDFFFDTLLSKIPRREGLDQMRWSLNGNGSFHLHSQCRALKAQVIHNSLEKVFGVPRL